jgi:hypothetical protein
MRKFFIFTAVLEVAVGLAMLLVPSLVTGALLGAPVTTPLESALARLCGAALLAVGVACWLVRDDWASRAAHGFAWGLVVWDAGAAGVLAYAGLGLGMSAPLLWPAVILHLALAAWGVLLAVRKRVQGVAIAR